MKRKAGIGRAARVVSRYVVAGGFLAVAVLAARHDVYWLCIAGAVGAGIMIVYIVVTTRSDPVTLDAYKDQQILVDRNKID